EMMPPSAGPATAAVPIETPVNAMERPIVAFLDMSATRLNAAGVKRPLENQWTTRMRRRRLTDGTIVYVRMITTWSAMPNTSMFFRPILSEKYPPKTFPTMLNSEYTATMIPAVYSLAPSDIANGVMIGSWMNRSRKHITIMIYKNLCI